MEPIDQLTNQKKLEKRYTQREVNEMLNSMRTFPVISKSILDDQVEKHNWSVYLSVNLNEWIQSTLEERFIYDSIDVVIRPI